MDGKKALTIFKEHLEGFRLVDPSKLDETSVFVALYHMSKHMENLAAHYGKEMDFRNTISMYREARVAVQGVLEGTTDDRVRQHMETAIEALDDNIETTYRCFETHFHMSRN